MTSTIPWISSDAALVLIVLKGIFAFVGTILLVHHINKRWDYMESKAQKVRFYLLLGYAVLSTTATYEQLSVPFGYRNLGGVLLSMGLVIAVIMSIREWHNGSEDF